MGFYRLEQAEVGRRLDGDRVAAPRDCLQRKSQGLGAAARDHNLLGRKCLSEAQGAAGDLLAQPQVAPRHRIDVVLAALHSGGPR